MDYIVTIKEQQGDSYRYGEARFPNRRWMQDVLDDIEEKGIDDEQTEWGEWVHPGPEKSIITVVGIRATESSRC